MSDRERAREYAQKVMDLVSGLANMGLDLGNEVWCVVGQGKGYAAVPGRLTAVTIEAFIDNDGKPDLGVECRVVEGSLHASIEDVFLARHQALRAIQERVAAEAALQTQVAAGEAGDEGPLWDVQTCRVCGCTDDDCSGCIERTGEPCYWVDEDLCSACAYDQTPKGDPA